MERLGRFSGKAVATALLLVLTWPFFSEIYLMVSEQLNTTASIALLGSLAAFYYLMVQVIVSFFEGESD